MILFVLFTLPILLDEEFIMFKVTTLKKLHNLRKKSGEVLVKGGINNVKKYYLDKKKKNKKSKAVAFKLKELNSKRWSWCYVFWPWCDEIAPLLRNKNIVYVHGKHYPCTNQIVVFGLLKDYEIY